MLDQNLMIPQLLSINTMISKATKRSLIYKKRKIESEMEQKGIAQAILALQLLNE